MGKVAASTKNVKPKLEKVKLTRRFKCDLCDYSAHYKSTLTVHTKVHVDESPLACSVPGCSFTTKWQHGLNKHKATHDDETTAVWYQCDKCDFKTKYKYVLEKRHVKLVHSEGPIQRRYKCDVCEYGSESKGQFLEHRRNHNKDTKPLTCDFPECAYTTRWKSSMVQHKKLRHGTETTWFKCDQCHYKTQRKHALRQHAETHMEEKLHKCPYPACNFAGRTANTVRHHQARLEHFVTADGEICEKQTSKKKYECTISGCKFSSSDARGVQRHMEIHDPKRKRDFKCPLCNKSFFNAGALGMHIRYHTGEKPVVCSFPNCNYRTLYPSDLKKHDARVHAATLARFTCSFPGCEASFKVAPYLKMHERRSHAGVQTFICTFPGCEAKFKNSNSLKKHLICHDPKGRPKYPCNLCSAEFLTRPSLYNHINGHTNEKGHICDNCGFSTSKSYLLSSHKCVGSTSSSMKRVVA